MEHQEVMMNHVEMLSNHNARIKNLEEDSTRHEKIYEFLTNVTVTQTEILKNIEAMGVEVKSVVEDVAFLKDNTETKQTVSELTKKVGGLELRLQTEENKEANQALKSLTKIKWLFISGTIGTIFTVIGAVIVLLIKL